MAVKTLSVELARGEAPQSWITAYKCILDSWRLFKARAELDNAINTAGIASNAEYQVRISPFFPLVSRTLSNIKDSENSFT